MCLLCRNFIFTFFLQTLITNINFCVHVVLRHKHKVRTYKEYHSVCPSSELGLPPTPHPQASVPPAPLPPVSGGRGTLAGEKGVGRVPIPTRGIHCGTLYMYVLCGHKTSVYTYTFTDDLALLADILSTTLFYIFLLHNLYIYCTQYILYTNTHSKLFL
jgi:hypothetical protein